MIHLITGGSGFLGNLIAKELLKRGEEVRIADVWDDPQRHPRIQFIHCDVRDRAKVREALSGVNIVHHNAAMVPLTKSSKGFLDVNVTGSRTVAEEAAKTGIVGCFVHMSSSAVYGTPADCPITLDTPTNPIEPYGHSKLEGELAVRHVCKDFHMPLIVIRPRTILGPGRLGIFQILFNWIRSNVNVYTIGSGNVPFQFVHAQDLMDAYMLAVERGKAGIYNVGTDRYGTLRQALENLVQHAGSRSRVRSLPEWLTIHSLQALDAMHLSPLAPWHYLTYHKPFCFDVQHVLDLGWQPRYSNDDMLQESYDMFLNGAFDQADAKSAFSPHRKKVKESVLWLLKKVS
ncbi:MAG: NAD-dependent epimerase/dehydratase family protein [Bryobacteraceae bacterium]